MQVKLVLPGISPFSINRFYTKDRIKTTDARKWSYMVNGLIEPYGHLLKELKDQFDATKHSLSIEIIAYYPNLLTKSNEMNSKVIDLSNGEKHLIDLLLLPANYGHLPHQCSNLSIDDRFVSDLISRKRIGEQRVEVFIALLDRNLEP